jgi:hypothetical protein
MASNLGRWFETRKRDSGEAFVTLKDGRPDWLYDAVREAHVSDVPNDWIFAECQAACDAIDEGYLVGEDSIHEYADGRVDVYTRELHKWSADMCLTDTYAEAEAEAQDLIAPSADVQERLGAIQYCAIRSIAARMLDAWRDAEDEGDADQEDASDDDPRDDDEDGGVDTEATEGDVGF